MEENNWRDSLVALAWIASYVIPVVVMVVVAAKGAWGW